MQTRLTVELLPRVFASLCFGGTALIGNAVAQAPFQVTETTIAKTQTALLSGKISCLGIVDAYLARIRAYDQSTGLNSIVILNPEVRSDADACDREIAATHHLRPLTGVAIMIKDNYDTRDLQTTGGSLAMK